MRKLWLTAGLAVLLAAVAPTAARAQVLITPFAGATFGGDTPASKFTTGLSFGVMGDVAGFEVDLGYTPDFFNEDDALVLIGDSNVTTLMGNLVIQFDDDLAVRPHIVAGLGLVRRNIDLGDLFDEVHTNDLGITLGGGVTGRITDHVGLRGDVRYIRSLEDPEDDDDPDVVLSDFDFWRATIGVVFSLP